MEWLATVRRHRAYPILLWGVLLFVIGVLMTRASQFMDMAWIVWDDYVQYWAASRLNLTGGNPYSPEQLGALEMSVGRPLVMMWNPPWTITVMMPLALLPYPVSRFIWYLLNIVILFFGSAWVWETQHGQRSQRWVAWLIAFTFGPYLHLLKAGQISVLLLLGALGFWYFERRGKPWAAGASALLMLIKPHVLYLLLVAIGVWALSRRQWRVVFGMGLAVIGATGLAWVVNPPLLADYWFAITSYPPVQWNTATLGGMLRTVFGVQHFWLQFVPPLGGLLWFMWYWWREQARWDWQTHFPLIVAVSVATAAYGWLFDETAMLVAILPIWVWLIQAKPGQPLFVWSLGMAGLYFGMNATTFAGQEQHLYWWLPTTLLLWVVLAHRLQRLQKLSPPSPLHALDVRAETP